ncbi:MAG: helix-turn-helix domain-containing protein [Nocardioides sp.]
MNRDKPRLSLRGRRVVNELVKRREALGWTLERAAIRSGISSATISRTENGEGLRAANVAALLAAYGAKAGEIQILVTLTKQARRRGWWATLDEAVMSVEYQDLAELEQEANWKKSFDGLLIPGLLQTKRYAELCVAATAARLSKDQQSERVEVRIRRQERLGHLEYSPILLEEVLRRPVGSASLMREQLSRLLEAVDEGHADLRVIPVSAGLHPGVLGSFSFLGGFSPVDATVAYVETPFAEMVYQDEKIVQRIQGSYDELSRLALDVGQSRQLVDRIRA